MAEYLKRKNGYNLDIYGENYTWNFRLPIFHVVCIDLWFPNSPEDQRCLEISIIVYVNIPLTFTALQITVSVSMLYDAWFFILLTYILANNPFPSLYFINQSAALMNVCVFAFILYFDQYIVWLYTLFSIWDKLYQVYLEMKNRAIKPRKCKHTSCFFFSLIFLIVEHNGNLGKKVFQRYLQEIFFIKRTWTI